MVTPSSSAQFVMSHSVQVHPASHETQRAAQLPHATDVADDAHTGSANEPVAFPRLLGGSSTLLESWS
jgi:hypothetical protein